MTDKDSRTFETRLQFINGVFSDLYPADVIMASCINHKLNATYDNYMRELDVSVYQLKNKDPLKVLKKLEL